MKSPKRQGWLKIWTINPFPQPSSWYFYIPEPLLMSAVVWLHFLDFMEKNGISFHHLWPMDLGRLLTLLKVIKHLGAAWEDSVFQYSLPSFFHVFAFLLFFSIASQAWNSVTQRGLHPSSIPGHRCSPRAANNSFTFQTFWRIQYFFLSQSLWAVNRTSAGNNTLVGRRRFTSSWIRQQQETKLRCLLRSLHQSDFAQSFQENSSAHTPTMPGRALLCWALSGFLQQPGLNFHGVFSFKETRKTRDTFSFCQNLHWWQGELICLEITATSQCGGMKREQTLLRKISLSPWHARSYSSCWGYRGEGGQGQDLSNYSKWVRKVLIDSNKDRAS